MKPCSFGCSHAAGGPWDQKNRQLPVQEKILGLRVLEGIIQTQAGDIRFGMFSFRLQFLVRLSLGKTVYMS